MLCRLENCLYLSLCLCASVVNALFGDLVQRCPRCHRANPADASFCHNDGVPLDTVHVPGPDHFRREWRVPSGRTPPPPHPPPPGWPSPGGGGPHPPAPPPVPFLFPQKKQP